MFRWMIRKVLRTAKLFFIDFVVYSVIEFDFK